MDISMFQVKRPIENCISRIHHNTYTDKDSVYAYDLILTLGANVGDSIRQVYISKDGLCVESAFTDTDTFYAYYAHSNEVRKCRIYMANGACCMEIGFPIRYDTVCKNATDVDKLLLKWFSSTLPNIQASRNYTRMVDVLLTLKGFREHLDRAGEDIRNCQECLDFEMTYHGGDNGAITVSTALDVSYFGLCENPTKRNQSDAPDAVLLAVCNSPALSANTRYEIRGVFDQCMGIRYIHSLRISVFNRVSTDKQNIVRV